MDKEIQVTIKLNGLPEAPNHNRLAVQLEEEINEAVIWAISEALPEDKSSVDFEVHVPSF